MDYSIFLTPGEPRFDALGVLKLRCPVSTPVDDRIFAQAQVGRTAELLYVRIWSFETKPAPKAVVRAIVSHGGHTLDLSATAAGEAALTLDGEAVAGKLTAYQVSGEDLQGEYWGAVLMLPLDWVAQALCLPQEAGAVLTGNLLREHPAVSSAVLDGETLRLLLN